MPRTFDGANDNLHCSSGALSVFTLGTMAAVLRRNGTTFQNVMTLHNSAGTSRAGIEIEDNGSGNNLQWQYDGNFVPSMTITVTNADSWVLIAMGKATGTSVVRCHKYVFSTGAWTHENSNGTATNSTAPGASSTMRFGEWEGGDDFAGDLAIAGAWLRNLSDTEVEQLATSLIGWYSTAPDALWLFDQQAITQTVADLTGGGANQTSIAGTAVGATNLPGLSYGYEILVPHSAPAGGGAPVTLGQAAETNSATALGRAKVRALGQPSETDTATTLGRSKTRQVAQATETDTATTLTRSKTRAVGQAAETDTAGVLAAGGSVTLGQAVESDTATALGRTKARAMAQAQETDTATSLGRSKNRLLAGAAETDTAARVGPAGSVVLGQALETGTAQPFGRSKVRAIGAATETGLAQALARSKMTLIAQATETDTAGAVSPPDSGVILRPDTGTTTRPASGTIVRPFTGVISRP